VAQGQQDHYATLGISRGATAEEIKRAYRRRARELHPDANPDDPTAEARFKEVARAYAVLSDPVRRRNYDAYGVDDGSGPQASPFDGGLGDVFSMLFGQGFGGGPGRPAGPPAGADLEARVDLAFEDAVFGTEAPVTVPLLGRRRRCAATAAAVGRCAGSASRCWDRW
jgi:molecular chaperone DnaJ